MQYLNYDHIFHDCCLVRIKVDFGNLRHFAKVDSYCMLMKINVFQGQLIVCAYPLDYLFSVCLENLFSSVKKFTKITLHDKIF